MSDLTPEQVDRTEDAFRCEFAVHLHKQYVLKLIDEWRVQQERIDDLTLSLQKVHRQWSKDTKLTYVQRERIAELEEDREHLRILSEQWADKFEASERRVRGLEILVGEKLLEMYDGDD